MNGFIFTMRRVKRAVNGYEKRRLLPPLQIITLVALRSQAIAENLPSCYG